MAPASIATRLSAVTADSKRKVSDTEKINALKRLFYIARDQKRPRYQNWVRNYKIVMNRMSGSNSASWLPQPRDSEIYPMVSSLVAWMTDQEPDVGFIPASDPDSPYYTSINQVTSDLDNVFQTTWINENYDAQVKKMLWDTFLFGLGTMKVVWDNAADGGGGNAVWRRCDPWTIYPDPYATSFDDMEYIVEVRRVSYSQLERMFPRTAQLITTGGSTVDGYDERPTFFDDGSSPKAPFLGALPQGNMVWNKKTSRNTSYEPLPGYILYEFWLKENVNPADGYGFPGPDGNAFKEPRWKCISMCQDKILYEEWADEIWNHGSHPYEDYRFDDIGEMYGIALVDHLAYPQIYINRLLTALQQNAELVGNPIFLEPTNSGLSRIGIVNRPGQRLPISTATAAGSNLPRWLEPPSMPPSVMDLVNFWIARIENTAGLSGLQKGQAPNQRNSGDVINNVQEAAFVRVRSAITNLQWLYRRASIKTADLIVQNFTDPRVMAIIGPEGNSTSLALRSHHFYDPGDDWTTPLKFIMRVEAGANAATSRQSRMANAEKLQALGVVDDAYVLKVHGVKDADKILQRLYMKRQQGLIGGGAGQRQRAGRTS